MIRRVGPIVTRLAEGADSCLYCGGTAAILEAGPGARSGRAALQPGRHRLTVGAARGGTPDPALLGRIDSGETGWGWGDHDQGLWAPSASDGAGGGTRSISWRFASPGDLGGGAGVERGADGGPSGTRGAPSQTGRRYGGTG